MTTTLVNLRNYKASDICYIDRRSMFGNPYKIRPGCTRKKSVALYRKYFDKRIKTDRHFREVVRELRGKKLACWCTPLQCHGDVIIEWLENDE